AFRRAHGEVATVIRDLQRGGAKASDAAHARDRLLAIESEARAVERELAPAAEESAAPAAHAAIGWQRAEAGDVVTVAGAGAGVLVSLRDRRGRVAVQVGAARIVVPRERVARAAEAQGARARTVAHVAVDAAVEAGEHAGGIERCDLRGLRVEEAIERLA